MASVVPTILAATPQDYSQRLQRAEQLSRRLHVDVCDGKFADAKTIDLAQVHVDDDVELDLHLMLEDPRSQLETALSLKPHLIIFHFESTGDLLGSIRQVKELGVNAGLAILPNTPVDMTSAVIAEVDHVLIFTGKLGHNGGEFDRDQLAKISQVRQKGKQLEISVDGGIEPKVAAEVARLGADVIYTGAYIQDATDPKKAFKELTEAVA